MFILLRASKSDPCSLNQSETLLRPKRTAPPVTYPQRRALPVVTSEVQDALCGHGQARVLGETRHPVLMFVQILLKQNV